MKPFSTTVIGVKTDASKHGVKYLFVGKSNCFADQFHRIFSAISLNFLSKYIEFAQSSTIR